MNTLIKKLNKAKQSIFTTREISLLSAETNVKKLNNRIGHYLKTGELILLRRGIYALSKNYDLFELATRINSPSYISFQTVLAQGACIFQYYHQIFLASYLSRNVEIGEASFVFKALKRSLLMNPSGLIFKPSYTIASLERAFLDTIYLYPGFYFDNLNVLNWDKCFELSDIYLNKSLITRLNKYYKEYKNAR